MAVNVGLRGRVVDEAGAPHAGLVVDARDRDVFLDDPLGWTRTDAGGSFTLRYAPSAYQGLVDARPDLVVRVRDAAGIRTLAETGTFLQTDDAVLDLPDIVVAAAEARGWLATAGSARPVRVSTGNHVGALVDGEAAFGAALDLVDAATRDIWLLQLLFEKDFQAAFPDGPTRTGRRLAEALRAARERGVEVRIVMNQNALIPDHADEIAALFRDDGAGRPSAGAQVIVRRFPMSPAVMHAKVLVRDGVEALVLGQPFEQRFWDTSAHRFHDARRGRTMPVHDASLKIRGPAVADVAGLFVELWNTRSHEAYDDGGKLLPPPPPAPAGEARLQIVLTTPKPLLRPEGERTILEAYERALANARDLAYLETQYFTSEAASRAILRALDASPGLEVIAVLNESMDIPLYNQWQRARLAELDHPRFRAYSLWQVGPHEGAPAARTVYVHSKVGLVDDQWAMLGSANLDGISLESGREFGLRTARSVDIGVVVLDEAASGFARDLRLRLWSEILGAPAPTLASKPGGGWIGLWDEAARRNLAGLEAEGALAAGHVLPLGATIPDRVRELERGMRPFTL